MKLLENEEYGYVSGRVVSVFLKAAIDLGVPEESLRSATVSEPFETYLDIRSMCLWNDFTLLADKVEEHLGGNEGMEAFGRSIIDNLKGITYYQWVMKAFSIRMAFRLHFRRSYNFPNFHHENRIVGDVAIIESWTNPKDIFHTGLVYFFKGCIARSSILFGYEAMEIKVTLDPDNRRFMFAVQIPPRRKPLQFIKHLFSVFTVEKSVNDMIDYHSSEVHFLTQKRQKELISLYGLIDNIYDPVLIVRGKRVITQNKAFNALSAHLKMPDWRAYFSEPDQVNKFLQEQAESASGDTLKTFLKRTDMLPVEVYINISSIKDTGSELEAIIRVLEAKPKDPDEILSLARELERKSLARDIHDSLGQLLTATSLQLATLEHTEEDEERSKSIAQISQMVREVTLYSRKFTHQLDLLIEDCHTIYDVVELIREEFSVIAGIQVRNRMSTDFHIENPEAIRHIAYILQEAMNNAFRHGNASQIVVASSETDTEKILSITDNGSGLAQGTTKAGLGLRSMEHRMKKIGGTLRCINAKDTGAIIECIFHKKTEPNIKNHL